MPLTITASLSFRPTPPIVVRQTWHLLLGVKRQPREPPLFMILHRSLPGLTNRIVGTKCASCCGVYRNWKYPSLHSNSCQQDESRTIHCEPAMVSRAMVFGKGSITYSCWRRRFNLWMNDNRRDELGRKPFSVEMSNCEEAAVLSPNLPSSARTFSRAFKVGALLQQIM